MSLIQVADLTFGYEGSADTVFEHVSFELDTDWKLGFVGRNGRGKTTFLRLLTGQYEYRGSISASVSFDYFPFRPQNPARSTGEAIAEIQPDAALWRIKRELSLLAVGEDVLERPFHSLSSGEQTKLLLAALFLREHQFLLIDEPTNHLDLQGRRLVSEYLAGKKGFILVSHDRAFLDGCVDHILSINKKDIQVRKGNFTSWQENMARQEAFELAENRRLEREVRHLTKAVRQTADWSGRVEKTKFGQRQSGIKPDKGRIGHKSAKMMKRAKVTEERRQRAAEEKAGLLQNVESTAELFVRPLTYHRDRLLEVRELRVFYGGRQICGPVDFELNRGERLFLRGKNGSGKSSILRLLAAAGESGAGDERSAAAGSAGSGGRGAAPEETGQGERAGSGGNCVFAEEAGSEGASSGDSRVPVGENGYSERSGSENVGAGGIGSNWVTGTDGRAGEAGTGECVGSESGGGWEAESVRGGVGAVRGERAESGSAGAVGSGERRTTGGDSGNAARRRLPDYTGSVVKGSRLIISYVPQDAGFLRGNLRELAAGEGLDESLFKTLLRKLDFTREQFDKDMADFSAGQKKKVLLAQSLSRPAHLYIWDEPLNYVDVLSRIQLEELILAYQPAMILVEHDLAFANRCATKIIEL